MITDPTRNRSPAIGYLLAFTLGVICMGMIALVTRERAGSRPPGTAHYSAEQSLAGSRPDLPRRTFADRAASLIGSPTESARDRTLPLQAVAKTNDLPQTSRPPAIFEASQAELPPTPEPVAIVPVPVAVVGGAAADGIPGRVFLKGIPAPEKVLPLTGPCQELHDNPPTTRFYVVGQNNGLADVVVHVIEGLPRQNWPAPRDHTLSLLGCVYDSYVSAARVGQTIRVQNLDDTMHNAHIIPGNQLNREVSFALLPNSPPILYSATGPDLNLRIKCDVHPWEFTYISLFDHPFFAVSDQNGQFVLPPLPPGEYTIEAFHRKSGTIQQRVRIEADRRTEINFSFTVPAELQAQR